MDPSGRSARGWQLSPMMRPVVMTALALGLASPATSQVTIDGSTTTKVTIGSNGAVTVEVAPASTRDSVSLNRYDTFNVPPAGVALDNRAEAARTIVNEVTGTSGSRLEGPLEVLGQKAHVIVANPNGIVINNGRFINTGRVALTTGQLGRNSQQIAPGIFQDNVTSTVTGGRITVEGGGLSGQMDAIDLIAQRIQIDGPVVNENTNDGTGVRLLAGGSIVEFDSSVLVGNTGLTWARITGGAGSTTDTIVEIADTGLLEGGGIEVLINDSGAGVRYAGTGRATSRGFVLRSDGEIDLTGSTFSGNGGLLVQSGSADLGNAKITVPDDTIQVQATNGITIGAAEIEAVQALFAAGSDLSFAGAEVSTTTGDVLLDAGGDLALSDSTVASGGSLVASAAGAFTFESSVATAFAHVVAQAGGMTLTDSTLEATNGTLVASVAGDAALTGSTVQGAVQATGIGTADGTASEGAVTLNVAGDYKQSSTEDTLAILFGAGGDVVLRSGGDVENDRGRILANGNINITALGDVINLVPAGPRAIDPIVETYSRKGARVWWTLMLKRKRTAGTIYDYGTVDGIAQTPVINASGDLVISANTLRNQGGEISASGGDLSLDAVSIETIGLGSGKVAVETVCVLACRSEAEGDVVFAGGQLNASGSVVINASDSFTNKAGQVFAVGDVVVNAPTVTLEAAMIPTLIQRPAGLYNFWASKDAWVLLRDQFGTILADTGNVQINSTSPVRRIGGEILAAGVIDLSAGEDIVRAPSTQSPLRRGQIGWLADWPFVRD